MELITKDFKNAVVKASKGCGNDKLAPLTTYMCLNVQNNLLYLRTTDGANFLVVKLPVKSKDFTAVVECDSFVNLIKKTTSEHITIELQDDSLHIKGNGKYTIACLLDEHGQPFEFPLVENSFDLDNCDTVNVKSKVFKVVSDVCTASVAKVLDVPVLTGFYFGDCVLTTDSLKLCSFDVDVFKRPVLLSASTIKLLTLFNEENVLVAFSNNDIIFKSDSMCLYASQMQDIESYPVEVLQSLLDMQYSATCSVKKYLLLATLERMSIFVNEYEKNAVMLHFTKQGLELSSKKANEIIPYDSSENFVEFSCLVELPKFKEQINTLQEDTVLLKYGVEDNICISENKIIHILSTMEES